MNKSVVSIILFFLFSCIYAQKNQLSTKATISVITSGPGKHLYEKFGHAAIRIQDPETNFDEIYNYGIFDFNAPNFYSNFVKGKLLYLLANYPFYYALKSANTDKRWTKEQVLNLTQKQKENFYSFLKDNALPENASYEYDPFYNNCATKPRDIIKYILGTNFSFSDKFITNKKSIRELMNDEIYWNTWGNFGINLALGSKLDKIASTEEYMFLPDYLFAALENSTINKDGNTEKVVSKTNILLNFKEEQGSSDVISPFLIFFILLNIGIIITFLEYKGKYSNKWFDFFLFFTTGIIGLLIVFLWFFTNHSGTTNNFNFLWAFFPNIIVAFFLLKKKKWVKNYIIFILVLLLLIPIIWITKIQLFNFSLIPLLLLLFIRFCFLLTSHKYHS